MSRLFKYAAFAVLCATVSVAARAQANVLVWHKETGTVDAQMRHEALVPLLTSIAGQTGWRVYVEPGSTLDSSTKFKNLAAGDALKMLLGNLNFALVPQTDSPWRLYVFRTVMKNATHLVGAQKAKHVPNELLIRVKPGTNIDALAKLLGAKIIGRMDKYGIYLLQFTDENSTDNSLAQLQMDSDVQAVGYDNYYDPPPAPQSVASAGVAQMPLTLSPPPASGKVVIGLVDTAVDPQSLGPDAAQFILPEVNVAGGADTGSGAGPTHGDAMASMILQAIANTTGSQQTSAQIQPFDVYASGDQTTTWQVINGFADAVNAGDNPINLSLGSDEDSPTLDSLIAQAKQDGVTVFAAAGNTPTGSPYYPAAAPGAYAVTALAQPGQLASYANSWDDPTMIALPGTGVFGFEGQSWVVQGTSPATALASGIFAGNLAAYGWPTLRILSAIESKFPVPGK